jgi:hypothetical protein
MGPLPREPLPPDEARTRSMLDLASRAVFAMMRFLEKPQPVRAAELWRRPPRRSPWTGRHRFRGD